MKVAITGSNGFLGSALKKALEEKGIPTLRLVRSKEQLEENSAFWNPIEKEIEKEKLKECSAVVHLAGENISNKRWTPSQKEILYQSRVLSTQFLSQTIAELSPSIQVLLSASAIGYYGNRGKQILTEDSTPGTGFLAKVCQDWEAATKPAEKSGIRVCHLRIGVVLNPQGGALKKMLLPFKLGLGGRLGNGNQFLSWIALEDLVAAIIFLLKHNEISGPVNLTAPNPITNKEFTKTLGYVLKRPTLLPIPTLALKILFGEMAEETLLASTRAIPAKLLDSPFLFQSPELLPALQKMLLSL
ncbi:MAG: TIGR01777 family protein [Planctomycetota bacterium]|nr:MAG: TIGR01777 family protein [Planctomycetota bacterium]